MTELDDSPGTPPGRRPEPEEPVTRGQLLTMLVVVYGLLALAGWWWLAWRERTAVLAESAVGPHGPLAAVALGCSVGLGLFFTTRLIARYAPAFAELELRLARTLGPLDDRDALLIALVSAAAEEFFFRCAMQDALGLWIAALLYALGHVTGPRQWLWSLQAGALALLFGWMVLGGFGILSAAVAHAVYGYLWLLRLTSR